MPRQRMTAIARGEQQVTKGRFLSVCLALLVCSSATTLRAQTTSATLSGTIMDPTGRVVPGVDVSATNIDTGVATDTKTNGDGIYVLHGLNPGHYRVIVAKEGFKQIALTDVVLNVQDTVSRNFNLDIGAASETVTVSGDSINVNTTDASVSTVIDRQFAENLPLNGRSFQTLIELAPGVVLTPQNSSGYNSGQFSVNGQRPDSNYWTVDGVSANIGTVANNPTGSAMAGTVGSFSALGGTNSLVSEDALQEFRIQTSTYAPEFGREPGGQISIVTRSGTNQFHGVLFDYLRNDALDANDWFADRDGLEKPGERQNDFGGTIGGPISKDRTFFFFSYEGLRLLLPEVSETTVPDIPARENAIPAVQPYFNAFPMPNGADLGAGAAEFNASYGNRATLDAYSLRIDHRLNDKWALFGRYNYSPSQLVQRGASGNALSVVSPISITTQTATLGATWAVSSNSANDFRFNYSRTNAQSHSFLDSFDGAVPLASLPFPNPFTAQDSTLAYYVTGLEQGLLAAGKLVQNLQRQINVVDTFAMQEGPHSLKFGVDYRRLTPSFSPFAYDQYVNFPSVSAAEAGSLSFSEIESSRNAAMLLRDLGLFAEDTWKVVPRLTVTYGVRWDIDFVPKAGNGLSLPALAGFNLANLSQVALAPQGTPPYSTAYGNFAPRLGIAYQVTESQKWQTVARGGFGVFYDLADQQVGNISLQGYPFFLAVPSFGGTFPLSPSLAAPVPIVPPNSSQGILDGFDPHLQLPYTLEWNVALEQALGGQQSLSASYIGATGRRLLLSSLVFAPNANYLYANLAANLGASEYNALQLQFQRRLSRGLQALASYTWSHSIDDGSAGSVANASNAFDGQSGNRGASDFDIRNSFSAGLTYDIPVPHSNGFTKAILEGWSTQNFIVARSAPPVNVYNSIYYELSNGFVTDGRPDVVPGVPLYLHGGQFPGGRAINPAAFTAPPINPTSGLPTRQGDLGRNALRGFGATQWDFAVHRDFPLRESLKVQFRAELFNVLNHPNFAPPIGDLSQPEFGQSTQTLGQELAGGTTGVGSLSPLYQLGGPRSIQFALKLMF
jgi:hypothetical protein